MRIIYDLKSETGTRNESEHGMLCMVDMYDCAGPEYIAWV